MFGTKKKRSRKKKIRINKKYLIKGAKIGFKVYSAYKKAK